MQTDYYDRPEISRSDLILIDSSIEHYLNKHNKPSTKPMDLGRAFHCYILESEKFDTEFIVKPEGLALNTIEGMLWREFNLIERYENRDLINLVVKNWFNPQRFDELYISKPSDIKLNTTDGKKWKSEHENFTIISEKDMEIVKSFELEKLVLQGYLSHYDNKSFEYVHEDKQYEYINANKTIISFDEFEWIKTAKRKFLEHPLGYLLQGENVSLEKEIYFEYQDLKCRAKLDYIDHSKRIIIDLKSISDCNKAEKECKFDYCSQAYFYQVACYEEYGEIYDVVYPFAEKCFPNGVKYIKFSADTLTYGKNLIDNAIDKYKNYLSNPEQYTGYSETLIEV